MCKKTAVRTRGSARHRIIRHSPRNGFTVYQRALPGKISSIATVAFGLTACSARLSRTKTFQRLDTSLGCQDHTPSPYASAPSSIMPGIAHEWAFRPLALRPTACLTLPRPPHLIPRFLTIAIRPSCWDKTKLVLGHFEQKGNIIIFKIFRFSGLTAAKQPMAVATEDGENRPKACDGAANFC